MFFFYSSQEFIYPLICLKLFFQNFVERRKNVAISQQTSLIADSIRVAQPIRLQHLHQCSSRILPIDNTWGEAFTFLVIFTLCKGYFLLNFQNSQCSLSPLAMVIQCPLKSDLATQELVKRLLANPVVVFFQIKAGTTLFQNVTAGRLVRVAIQCRSDTSNVQLTSSCVVFQVHGKIDCKHT